METVSEKVIQMCRTCLCTNRRLHSMLEHKDGLQSAFDMMAITNVHLKMRTQDELPKQMCNMCYRRLIIAYEFHQMTIESDRELRAILCGDISCRTVIKKDESPIYLHSSTYISLAESPEDFDPLVEKPLLNRKVCIKEEVSEELTMESHLDHQPEYQSGRDASNIIKFEEKVADDIQNKVTHGNSDFNDDDDDNVPIASLKRKAYREATLHCKFCPKVFKQSKRLQKHIRTHESEKEQGVKTYRRYTCKQCDKVFIHNSTLKTHLRTHTGEKPFLCPECGKSFKSRAVFHQHTLRHSGLKRHQCSECPSKFPCKADLIKHMSVHRSFKPHVCDICGSRFSRSYTLNKHRQIHTGLRPYKCEQCEMTFVWLQPMIRHMRTHTGEKPYKCKFCDRAYSASGDLNKHLRTHVGENTYMCTQCPDAFKYLAELRQHQSQHYKEQQAKTT